jgi:hypothetical protein
MKPRREEESNPSGITVNGQPLEDLLKDEEIVDIRIEVTTRLKEKIVRASAPGTKRRGTGSGRGAGNPGVKRGRRLTQEEVAEENRKRGFTVIRKE